MKIQRATFEEILKYGSNLPIEKALKPSDYSSCKYGRFEQLIWIAYNLVFHEGKMRSIRDEYGNNVTYVDDIERVDIFAERTRKDVREKDAKELYELTGIEVNPDNGLFSGIILGFPENLSVTPAREGHGYLIINADYSYVSPGTKRLINNKLRYNFL